MAKKKENREGYGKILDAWNAPEGSGDPIGCIATSFTFSPVFFEEECISRFIKLETDPNEDGPLYLIEREEKLSQVVCAAALVDQHNCKGIRSLRWDMLPARVPAGILHSKISLLCWTQCIRLIVASANLTQDGYRRNQEIFGVLDYNPGSDAPLSCLRDVTQFLRKAGSYSESSKEELSPALNRWNNFLEKVDDISEPWGIEDEEKARKQSYVWPVLSGDDSQNVFEKLFSIWPKSTPPKRVHVVSPFFDPPGAKNRPSEELWKFLPKRGEAGVSFYVSSEDIPGEDTVFLHAPESLLFAQPKGRQNVYTEFYRASLDSGRSLHAKAIWLEDDQWLVYMIGSSNFTSPGLGLAAKNNLEANLVYGINHKKNPKAYKAIQKSFLEGKIIDLDQSIKWQPRKDEGEDSSGEDALLPEAFGFATYDRNKQNQSFITLHFVKTPPHGWQLLDEENEAEVFTETMWEQKGRPDRAVIPWANSKPPSGFWVTWNDTVARAWWPVNVASVSSLPPPQELKDLPLEVLINILTSAQPLHRALKGYIKNKKRNGGNGPPRPEINPHAKVDTSRFLLQRTRRVAWALNALRERIERPVVSEDCLEWRLYGPVGVQSFAEALVKEAHSDEEKAFLISELALELARAKPKAALNCLPVNEVREKIQKVILELKELIPFEPIANMDSLNNYVEKIFKVI